MKRVLILLTLFSCFVSCKTQQPITEIPIKTEIIIKERLIPVYIPADSAYLVALFECDSNYNVLLKSFAESKTKGVESNLTFNNGKLNYKATAKHDTVYLKAKDSIVFQDKPIKVPVPYEVNKLTDWQIIQIWLGRAFLVIMLLVVVIGLIRSKLK